MNVHEANSLADIECDRDIDMIALTGSRNYNIHTELSDYDWIGFVTPTKDEMYHHKYYFKEFKGEFSRYTGYKDSTAPNDYSIRIHDLRKLPELLYKSNPSYLEILFSRDSWCRTELDVLFKMNDEIARMNLPYMYNATIGIIHSKMSKLDKGTVSTQHLVDKFGYDTKQAMHAIRLTNVLYRFADNGFERYGECIKHEEYMRSFLLEIRWYVY